MKEPQWAKANLPEKGLLLANRLAKASLLVRELLPVNLLAKVLLLELQPVKVNRLVKASPAKASQLQAKVNQVRDSLDKVSLGRANRASLDKVNQPLHLQIWGRDSFQAPLKPPLHKSPVLKRSLKLLPLRPLLLRRKRKQVSRDSLANRVNHRRHSRALRRQLHRRLSLCPAVPQPPLLLVVPPQQAALVKTKISLKCRDNWPKRPMLIAVATSPIRIRPLPS